tara:strand:- start:21 stop:533 length:513 start_codon:yes stop_codon:yes gene_type:complete
MKADMMRQITNDLNEFVREIHLDLSTDPGPTPVLTGFMASHWKAGTKPIRTIDTKVGTKWDMETTKVMDRIVLKSGSPIIDPVYFIKERFKINQKIYIGNTAEYTAFALGPPGEPTFGSRRNGIPTYVQGKLKAKVGKIFTDKKPRINVASGQSTAAFGREGYTVDYSKL